MQCDRQSLQAARYQMIMMFLIAATTGLGSTSAVYAATATIVDTEHRIRPERLRPRGSRGAKLADKLHDIIVGVRLANSSSDSAPFHP